MPVSMRRKRLYGKRGFTLRGRLGTLLNAYEGSIYGYTRLGDLVPLDAIPVAALREIRDLLPEGNKADAQNESPTLSEFCAMDVPGIHFHGYRVEPERDDERVTIEGFYCLPEYSQQLLALCPKPPNEADTIKHPKLGRVFRAWWD